MSRIKRAKLTWKDFAALQQAWKVEPFLFLDLNYGRRVDSELYEFLMDNGKPRPEYHFFMHTLMNTSRIERRPGALVTGWFTFF